MVERWHLVSGHDYLVSDRGRVASLLTNRILRPGSDGDFYPIVVLRREGTSKTYKVHRLVLETFCQRPDDKMVANHLNGVKGDNRLENLEWCTQSENHLHAYRTGLRIVTDKQRGFGIHRNPKGVNQWTKGRSR